MTRQLTFICLLASTLLLSGCESENPEPENPVDKTGKSITAFTFDALGSANIDIDEIAETITAIVPLSANRKALAPTITHTGASVDPPSGETQDFTSAVIYTVTAIDGSTKSYAVTVETGSKDKSLTKFNVDSLQINGMFVDNNKIILTLPYGTDATKLKPDITWKGYSINPPANQPVDFTKPVVYTVMAADGSTLRYTVQVNVSEHPIMLIHTPNNAEITSVDNWLEAASYTLYDGQKSLQNGAVLSGKLDIKGRGNTTWSLFEKKPYGLKLEKGANNALLGMPAHRRWSLLANASDKTLLRTEVALTLGQRFTNLKWTPHAVQIVVYMNKEYIGVYQLIEQIKLDANRVNISETISKKKPNGGYLLEFDSYLDEAFNFRTTRNVPVCCSDPDDELEEVFEKIKTQVQAVENSIYAENFKDPTNGYRKYIDVPSFVDFYLVNEIIKNPDTDWGSVYSYYDPTTKKHCFGPIWDFDISLGNNNDGINSRWPTDFMVKNESFWLPKLFEDPYFVAQVKARWAEKKAEVYSIIQHIDAQVQLINKAQVINFIKWDVLEKDQWPNSTIKGGYQEEVDYLKSWLTERIAWIDAHINEL